jgi:hypothetical protein
MTRETSESLSTSLHSYRFRRFIDKPKIECVIDNPYVSVCTFAVFKTLEVLQYSEVTAILCVY